MGGESNSNIVWFKWVVLCNQKSKGGLGVKDFGCFNKALMWEMDVEVSKGKRICG